MHRFILSTLILATACTTGSDAEDSSSGSSSSTGEPTTGGESTGTLCPVGAESCPCTSGGSCDDGLACEAGACAPGCTPGDKGCTCSEGGGCFTPWVCMAGTCEEGVSETCGDGQVDEFEECDGGDDNSDAGACTSSCKTATCGDGLVGPGETCDGGDGCTATCVLSSCGNGKLDPGEECEPASEDDVECSTICTDARKIVFVTSEMYKGGEIGGVAGGDAKCQALADKAGLLGTFLSWLATSEEDAPSVRLNPQPLRLYVDVAGEHIADSWETLYSQNTRAPLLTEKGSPASDSELTWPWMQPATTHLLAWASRSDGPGGAGPEYAHCNGWIDVNATASAMLLDPNKDIPYGGSFWVSWYGAECSKAAPLLCIER